jgi:cysteine desulfurase
LKRIYLDHNATTRLRPEVKAAWLAALDQLDGNPSSLHESGRRARHVLDEARERTAAALGVGEDEIVFTSSGTESNNLALFGALRPLGPAAGLVTTTIEHSAVLAPARQLAREGHPVAFAPVTSEGLVELDALRGLIGERHCRLVSIMAANNEIGVCMPLAEVAALLANRAERPLFHSDAVQALGRIPLRLREWGIDLATFSAHKLGGPLGVGVLFRRRDVALQPILLGGEQEGGLRPGTENVAAIAAASLAIELAVREQAQLAEHASRLARALWDELGRNSNDIRLLGPNLSSASRLPGTLNLVAAGVDGKVLVARLDLEGLEVSAGSACASGSLEPSHVLLALGLDQREARAGLRVSFGRENTLADARQAVDILRRTLGADRATRAGGWSS